MIDLASFCLLEYVKQGEFEMWIQCVDRSEPGVHCWKRPDETVWAL